MRHRAWATWPASRRWRIAPPWAKLTVSRSPLRFLTLAHLLSCSAGPARLRISGRGPLDGLARNHINTRLIAEHWDEICRLTASLRAGTVVPSAILRTLQRGPAPSSLTRALAELGRVIKTLHGVQPR